MSKPSRQINRDLLDSYHDRRCLICGHTPCDPCHIKSRGAGGDDIESNIIPMCRAHHTEQHSIGWPRFCERYAAARGALKRRGWAVAARKLIRE